MRKNKMMRTAAVLGVAALLTTSALSGTLAKYTTSTNGSDEARVAYWGFNQDANTTIDLFDATYNNVQSEDSKNVIAPGTEKTSTFAFGYDVNDNAKAPEVKYALTVDATATGSYAKLDKNSSFKWTLKTPKAATATEYDTVAELTAAIEALAGDESGTKEYEPGKLPDTFTAADEVYTVGWKWAFDNNNDSADTIMGNAATLDNVKLVITITATQID
ncbi:hypothetical protein [Blautia sp. MSJ-19]|uniref:hypothetical protein n=1 Tax=Blautia sp. MSJ-19 TaxID=2841517 RepID=UPI001C0EB914|nr:hypothetical protein [Blautia sp. MSJ-19]MBU5481397.1 hypothetical protein [Blautia sp. MSJ-19]